MSEDGRLGAPGVPGGARAPVLQSLCLLSSICLCVSVSPCLRQTPDCRAVVMAQTCILGSP